MKIIHLIYLNIPCLLAGEDLKPKQVPKKSVNPSESAVIGADIAIKSGDVYLGFVDRFSGTLILTGRISAVESAVKAVIHYFQNDLGYATCPVTKK